MLDQVTKFSYLGSVITQNGRCDEDIWMRSIIAIEAFNKVKNLVTNTSISVGLSDGKTSRGSGNVVVSKNAQYTMGGPHLK